MVAYKPRIADRLLTRKLAGKGAVLIEGPKWCGKTTTAKQQAATVLYLDDPAQMQQNLRMADINPSALLAGTPPVLIDERRMANHSTAMGYHTKRSRPTGRLFAIHPDRFIGPSRC